MQDQTLAVPLLKIDVYLQTDQSLYTGLVESLGLNLDPIPLLGT